jgi:hypothetical protein
MDTFCYSEKIIHGNKLVSYAKPFQNPKHKRHETLSCALEELVRIYFGKLLQKNCTPHLED